MKKVCKRIHVEVRRYIAILLVLTMIPIPSFPVKAVEVEEIPMENKVQHAETISEDTMQYEIVTEQSLATQTDTVQSTVTQSVDTDCANAYLDPAIREKSIGDVKISENWVLEEDAVVDELVMVGESIDLNGYTLTVCEDLIFEKGELITSGGELIVWGDLRMQSRIWDEEQGIYSYGSSTAKFRTYYISEETVYILVAGDIKSHYSH